MATSPSPHEIGALYTEQAGAYADFWPDSFAWNYIERPAYDRYISDLYTSETKVLDLCCGAGVVIEHLVERGVAVENIVGLDISHGQLLKARQRIPGVSVVLASADALPFAPNSFDLITSNMALHYLDNDQVTKTMELAFDVLKPGSSFFIVDSDPDTWMDVEDNWLEVQTPWGQKHPLFNRNLRDFLLEIAYYAGFDQRNGWTLPVTKEGLQANPEEYVRYTSKPARMGIRLVKVTEEQKQFRIDNIGKTIPSLGDLACR